jgi:hypothetical protein
MTPVVSPENGAADKRVHLQNFLTCLPASLALSGSTRLSHAWPTAFIPARYRVRGRSG